MLGLRRRLLVLVLIAVVPALGLILYNATEERYLRVSAIRENAQRIVQLAAIRHNRLVDSSRQLLTVLAEVPSVKDSDPSCNRVLSKLLDRYGYYSNLGVIQPGGNVSCSAVDVQESINLADRSYFRILKTDPLSPDIRVEPVHSRVTGACYRKMGLTDCTARDCS